MREWYIIVLLFSCVIGVGACFRQMMLYDQKGLGLPVALFLIAAVLITGEAYAIKAVFVLGSLFAVVLLAARLICFLGNLAKRKILTKPAKQLD